MANKKQRRKAKQRKLRKELRIQCGITNSVIDSHIRAGMARDKLLQILPQLIGRTGKFHVKNRPVYIIRDESIGADRRNDKAYAFSSTRKTVDKKQSRIVVQFFPECNGIRLCLSRQSYNRTSESKKESKESRPIPESLGNKLRLGNYGFRYSRENNVGWFAERGDIDKLALKFSKLSPILELLP